MLALSLRLGLVIFEQQRKFSNVCLIWALHEKRGMKRLCYSILQECQQKPTTRRLCLFNDTRDQLQKNKLTKLGDAIPSQLAENITQLTHQSLTH